MTWLWLTLTALAYTAGWITCTLFAAYADDHRHGRIDHTGNPDADIVYLDRNDPR